MRHTPVLDADAHGLEAALDGGTHGLDVASAVADDPIAKKHSARSIFQDHGGGDQIVEDRHVALEKCRV